MIASAASVVCRLSQSASRAPVLAEAVDQLAGARVGEDRDDRQDQEQRARRRAPTASATTNGPRRPPPPQPRRRAEARRRAGHRRPSPCEQPVDELLGALRVVGALRRPRRRRRPRAAGSRGSSIASSVAVGGDDVGDVDEAGVDRALGELADDPGDVGLVRAHVGEDRLALGASAAGRAPRACSRRPARPRRRSPDRDPVAGEVVERVDVASPPAPRARACWWRRRPASRPGRPRRGRPGRLVLAAA